MSLLNVFSRLSLQSAAMLRQPMALLHSTPVLCAEPLKKKKKLDPQIIKQRDDRRKKKLEKQIRRLEKNARQLKPVEDLEIPLNLMAKKKQSTRNLPPFAEAELQQRVQLNIKWTRYKHEQKIEHYHVIDRLMQSQQKALDELRLESEALYKEAIQPDISLMPVKMNGPVATPPIESYVSPNGDYIVESITWD